MRPDNFKEAMPSDNECPTMCSRRKTADEIRQKARRLHDQAHALEQLADNVDHGCLSPDADEVLFNMVMQYRPH